MRAIPVLFLWACAAAALAAAEEAVTFAYQIPPLGQTVRQTSALELRLDVTARAAGKIVQQGRDEFIHRQTRRETVLALDGKRLTGLKVHYERVDFKQAGDVPAPSAVEGQTYLVEHRDGALQTRRTDGRALHLFEKQKLEEDFGAFHEADPLAAYLDGRGVKLNEKLAPDGKLARKLLNLKPADPEQIETFELTLTGTRKAAGFDCAVFKARLVMSKLDESAGNKQKMTTAFDGELLIGIANTWLVEAALAGPVRVAGHVTEGGLKMEVEGAGKVKLNLESRVVE
ncbi:MAG: hypothetical protein HS116_28675 [Planctomycetes bacterium]|nr:hypothetical protein [Planctomycetota bacterium]